ncbi:nicotinic acid mononucleotide adenyltransferase [Paucihalobacter sp.]|uniref:nicotinic acid mononucleotide adenyltransferase n=1 Tax=Paucihalobacter sp. TaxID=2850405 RepID=UPI002FE04DCE
MRKLLILIVALICSAAVFSQETKENEYTVKNNVIEVTMFHDNGQISQTGFYTLDGKLQGNWFSYDVHGKKVAAAKYDNGNKVGKWFFWNDKTLKEVDYSTNAIVSVVEWSNDRTLVSRD